MKSLSLKNISSSIYLDIYCFLLLIFVPLFYIVNKYYFVKEFTYGRFLASPYFVILAAILLLFYIFIILRLDEQILRRYYKKICIFLVIISIILILLPVVSFGDIYQYISQAKIYNQFQQNPYSVAPDKLLNTELLNNIPAPFLINIYGPLWTLISIFWNLLSFNNLALNVILLKINNLFFLLATTYFIRKITILINPRIQLAAPVLFLLNPLILIEVLLNGHNDIVMAFFLIFALYFLCQQKYFWVLPCFTLAFLTKFYCLIFLPLFLVFLLYGLCLAANRRQIAGNLLLSVLLSVFIFILAWLPSYSNFNFGYWSLIMGNIFNHFLLYWPYAKFNWDFNVLKNIFSGIFYGDLFFCHLASNKK